MQIKSSGLNHQNEKTHVLQEQTRVKESVDKSRVSGQPGSTQPTGQRPFSGSDTSRAVSPVTVKTVPWGGRHWATANKGDCPVSTISSDTRRAGLLSHVSASGNPRPQVDVHPGSRAAHHSGGAPGGQIRPRCPRRGCPPHHHGVAQVSPEVHCRTFCDRKTCKMLPLCLPGRLHQFTS